MSRTRINSFTRKEKAIGTAETRIACLVVIAWFLSALLSLAISGGILTAIVAGVYYLCTGEFLFAS